MAIIALAALVAAPQPQAPNRAQLAKAIAAMTGKRVAATNLRAIACKPMLEEPTEFACRWQQRSAARWRSYSSILAVDGTGWILIDTPGLAR